jgi:competence CoiA-like predicted nuclease
MLFAHDENGERIKPQKGKTGFCPICNEIVLSVCGPINIDHWRHEPNPNCDTWIEPETYWHRQWKNEFPEDWQEIVINRFGVIHRADIMTDTGLVLEIQNSSISSTTIQEREDFYKDLVWLN